MASVQKAILNITGPLCCLHDALTSNKDVPKEDVQSIMKQSLCLLGSANYQFSTLRRKKVLVATNKDKMALADQRMLFGDDFPSIASKQADLSRGLSKNLASGPAKRPRQGSMRTPNRVRPKSSAYNKFQGTYNKYQGSYNKYQRYSRKKRTFLSSLQARGKIIDTFIDRWREITSDQTFSTLFQVTTFHCIANHFSILCRLQTPPSHMPP